MIDNNFLETIISLAPNLFFGTSIAVNILVLSKHKTDNSTQFIDASNLFKKETNNNVLTDEHIAQIIELFDKKENIAHLASQVEYQHIVANDYNLAVSSYVEAQDTREVIDIKALNQEITEIVSKVNDLRDGINQVIVGIEKAA